MTDSELQTIEDRVLIVPMNASLAQVMGKVVKLPGGPLQVPVKGANNNASFGAIYLQAIAADESASQLLDEMEEHLGSSDDAVLSLRATVVPTSSTYRPMTDEEYEELLAGLKEDEEVKPREEALVIVPFEELTAEQVLHQDAFPGMGWFLKMHLTSNPVTKLFDAKSVPDLPEGVVANEDADSNASEEKKAAIAKKKAARRKKKASKK